MKNQTTKKLFTFILLMSGMFSFTVANAQIVYTDVNPDITKTCTASGNPYSCSSSDSIDINNDGVFDLKLELNYSVTGTGRSLVKVGSIKASPLHGSAIITNSSAYPLKMNLNDVIGSLTKKSSNIWSTNSNQILLYSKMTSYAITPSALGNWYTATDGYLGVKIISESQTYYCWVRLNVSVVVVSPFSATYTIKDFAFDGTSNNSILAGATSGAMLARESSLNSLNENDLLLNVFPNPVSISTSISFSLSQSQNVSLKVFNESGRLVSTLADKIFEAGENELVWSAAEVNTGIYFVQLQTAENLKTEKLIVTK